MCVCVCMYIYIYICICIYMEVRSKIEVHQRGLREYRGVEFGLRGKLTLKLRVIT